MLLVLVIQNEGNKQTSHRMVVRDAPVDARSISSLRESTRVRAFFSGGGIPATIVSVLVPTIIIITCRFCCL